MSIPFIRHWISSLCIYSKKKATITACDADFQLNSSFSDFTIFYGHYWFSLFLHCFLAWIETCIKPVQLFVFKFLLAQRGYLKQFWCCLNLGPRLTARPCFRTFLVLGAVFTGSTGNMLANPLVHRFESPRVVLASPGLSSHRPAKKKLISKGNASMFGC